MVENLLISFPEGKVTDLAVAGNMLFCSSPDGLREYEILDNGRLRYKTIWTDFKELISLSASGDTVYLVKKDMPQRIFTIQPEKGQFQTPFKDFEKIRSLLAVSGKVYAVCGQQLLDQNGNNVLPEAFKMEEAYPAGKDKIMIMASENMPGNGTSIQKKKVICLLRGADGKIIRKIDAGNLGGRSFFSDGERLVWHQDGCVKVASFDDLQKQMNMPVVYNEAPVVLVPPYVYGFDRSGGSRGISRLYGFDLRKEQNLQKQIFDVCLTWPYDEKQPGFYYDIVLQPYDYLKVDNKYLFVPGALLDISNPAEPVLLDSSMALAASYAINGKKQIFLAQGSKMTVLDGTKLPEIKVLTEIPADPENMPMWSDVIAEGDYLYANGRNKLVVYRITDLDNPVKVASLTYPEKSNVYNMAKNGKYLYCPNYSFFGGDRNPLNIIDISDPEKPVFAPAFQDWPETSVLQVTVDQNKLYVGTGIQVIRYDVSDPLNPVKDKEWTAPDKAMQDYYYTDVCDGILAAKKYPRIDAWRIEE